MSHIATHFQPNTSLLNSSLEQVRTYVGSDGKLHFVDASGADSVLNFSGGLNEATFYFSGAGAAGNISIPRSIIDAMGWTKAEITPGVNLYNGKIFSFSTFNDCSGECNVSNRVEYSISSVKIIDVSPTSAYSLGLGISQSGGGASNTVYNVGSVRFYKV